MGTRNLTCVYMDGEYKVAQYCQWDGYPAGQGITILQFLREKVNWIQFTKQLNKISWVDGKRLNQIFRSYGGDANGFIECSKADVYKRDFPEFSRDTGAKILEMIQNDKTTTRRLQNSLDFAANSDCEWCYVIDIDKGTFEVYKGYNLIPLTPEDRFYFLADKEDGWYSHAYGGLMHGVKLKKEYSLDDLPTDDEFITECDPPEKDEEE